jgi:ubiquinone/menaquinone biosynthesis C-methylase UbiE
VLDFGCGAGALCFKLAEKGFEARGVNISERQISIARDEARARRIDSVSFDLCDGETLPYPDESFDAVLFQESMCHVPDKAAMVREFDRVLKPGGVFAGQDFFAGASAPPPAFELAAINQAYRTFLEPIARYLELAEPAFTDLQAVDCADLAECTALSRFGGDFWPRILQGYFTVGFVRGRKRPRAA